MPASIIVGKGAAFFVGAFEISVDEVSVESETEDIKDKSSTALGRVGHTGGFSTTKLTIKGYYDVDNNPHAVLGRNMKPGVKLANVKWELIKGDPLMRYLFPSVVVESFKVVNVAEKRAEVDGSFTVDGTYKQPGDA